MSILPPLLVSWKQSKPAVLLVLLVGSLKAVRTRHSAWLG